MSDTRTGIAPEIRDELKKIAISAIELTKNADGAIMGGTVTFSDESTIEITVKTAE